MIKSMTGYGRGRVLADGLDITFEIKSVNNRYMDLNIRMPRAFAPLEERVKALVGAAVSRGKVDVYIGVEHLNGECVRLSLNREYLEGYLAVLGQVGKEYGISGEVTLDMVAARSEVFLARKAEEDAEKVWPLMERAAREALDAFAAMRKRAMEADFSWTRSAQSYLDIYYTVTGLSRPMEHEPAAPAEGEEETGMAVKEPAGSPVVKEPAPSPAVKEPAASPAVKEPALHPVVQEPAPTKAPEETGPAQAEAEPPKAAAKPAPKAAAKKPSAAKKAPAKKAAPKKAAAKKPAKPKETDSDSGEKK